jgi:hypothetical protein
MHLKILIQMSTDICTLQIYKLYASMHFAKWYQWKLRQTSFGSAKLIS